MLDYGGDRGQFIPASLGTDKFFELSDVVPVPGVARIGSGQELNSMKFDVEGVDSTIESVAKYPAKVESLYIVGTSALIAQVRHRDTVTFWAAMDCVSREGIEATLKYLRELDSYKVGFRSYQEPSSYSAGPFRELMIAMFASFASLEQGEDQRAYSGRVGEGEVTGARWPVGQGWKLMRRR